MSSKRFSPDQLLVYTLLIGGSLLMLAPFVWMILASFKTTAELNAYPPTFWPKEWSLAGYKKVLGEENQFLTYFFNSAWIGVVKTALVVYTSSIVGYVLGKIKFTGNKAVFALILATMMVPWPVTIISLYQEMLWFGWLNSYTSIILPFITNSFGIFLMKQFVDTVPSEVIEACRIDGASEFGIFHKIILPLMGPSLSALSIFIFIGAWDDFLWPFLMLTEFNKYTLPIGLALFQGQYWTDLSSVLVGATIASLPVIIFYVIFQKRIVEGITMTGLK